MKKGKILIRHQRFLHRPEHSSQCLVLQRSPGPGRAQKLCSSWINPQIPSPLGNPRKSHHTQLLTGGWSISTWTGQPKVPQKGKKRAPNSLWAELGWAGGAGEIPAPGTCMKRHKWCFQRGISMRNPQPCAPSWGIALEEGGRMSLPCHHNMNYFSYRGHSKLLFKIIILDSPAPRPCMNPSASNLSSTPSKPQHQIN